MKTRPVSYSINSAQDKDIAIDFMSLKSHRYRGIQMLSTFRNLNDLKPVIKLYEDAYQYMIRESVENIYIPSLHSDICSSWIKTTSPIRIDLAGAWTDTPPICIEHGGCVVNVAATLDNEYPIGTVARLIPVLLFFQIIFNCRNRN